MSEKFKQTGSVRKYYNAETVRTLARPQRTVRKYLNADALLEAVKKDFQKIPDHRADNTKISLDDALISALAMFQLKDRSLLAFDKRRREEPENLHTVFGVTNIPCDSQMRTILDPVNLSSLGAPFRDVFRQLQCGRDFEKMSSFDGHYLLSGDGPGFIPPRKCPRPIAWARETTMATYCIIDRCMLLPSYILIAKRLFRSFLK